MDPKTLQLILFAEQMVALAAKTIADLRMTLQGDSTKAVDTIIDSADAKYQQIIDAARQDPGTGTGAGKGPAPAPDPTPIK